MRGISPLSRMEVGVVLTSDWDSGEALGRKRPGWKARSVWAVRSGDELRSREEKKLGRRSFVLEGGENARPRRRGSVGGVAFVEVAKP